MLTHQDIWAALDALAVKFSMSPSAMARAAGLDPTTFNKSKRTGADGKARWPSTESLSKVLAALGVSFEDFAAQTAKSKAGRFGMDMGANIPLIDMRQAGQDGYFDETGSPVGEHWDEIRMPGLRDNHVFALQIPDDFLAPFLRAGDRIIVSPAAAIKRGDRVVVKLSSGELLAKVFKNMSTSKLELHTLDPQYPGRTIALKDIQWMARIVWISQ